jgi:hypothetical protein
MGPKVSGLTVETWKKGQTGAVESATRSTKAILAPKTLLLLSGIDVEAG